MLKITDKTYQNHTNIVDRFVKDGDLAQLVSDGATTVVPVERTSLNDSDRSVWMVSMSIQARVKHLGVPGQTRCSHDVFTNGAAGSCNLTKQGDCGVPYYRFLNGNNRKIYGLHQAGSPTQAYCVLVTQEILESLIDADELQSFEPEVVKVLREDDGWELLLDGEGEPTQRVDETGLDWIGSSTNSLMVRPPTKTKLYRTGIEIPDFDNHEPSVLSRRDPRNPNFPYMTKGLKLYAQEHKKIDPHEIRMALRFVAGQVISLIRSSGKTLRKFTLIEAINGPCTSEYETSKPVNRSSAVGFPYAQKFRLADKKDYLYFDEEKQIWLVRKDKNGENLLGAMNRLQSDAASGRGRAVVFSCYGKDELVKKKKIYGDKAKTRVFMSAPFPYVLSHRRYFLSAFERIQEIFRDIPIKIGINAKGRDWDEMYHDMSRISSYGFDTDCANWDANINPIWQSEMTDNFWNPMFQKLDPHWTPKDDTIRRSLHAALEKPVVITGTRIYQLPGGQVSGQPGTAIENSIINWALSYIVWRRLAMRNNKDCYDFASFREKVGLAVYGDDMICSVDVNELPWYNRVSYMEEAATLGFDVTDALKTGEIEKWNHLQDLSFLKRTFREEGGWIVGPLDLHSIIKSICWSRFESRSYEITPTLVQGEEVKWPTMVGSKLLEDGVNEAMAELSLHGEEIYDEIAEVVYPQARRLGIKIKSSWIAEIDKLGLPIVTPLTPAHGDREVDSDPDLCT